MQHQLIINADDFGYSRAVNYGILDAHLEGILTSTTLMANMPGFDHAVELKKKTPTLGVGVHLVLTCDDPLIKGHQTIANNDQFLKLSHYESGNYQIDPDELYREWKAQIEKVLAAGVKPTHLDSHHHIHTFEGMTEVFLKLAKEYDLPVRGNFSMQHQQPTTKYFESRFDNVGFKEELQLTDENIDAYLEEVYALILENESIEVMTHPAYIDSKLLGNSSFTLQRLGEMQYLTTHDFAKKIRNNPNIQLCTYADLKK